MLLRRSLPSQLARRALCTAIALSVGATLAQPSGLTVLHGNANVQQAGSTTTITTANGAGTRHSALDWMRFDVPGGQTVFFAQPDALSASINRVTGSDPSTIAGRLGSNGRLVLVNPAGITVGSGAVVDTAGFTASTLRMSRSDAIAGRLRFEASRDGDHDDDDDRRSETLKVEGSVLARNGVVVLIGPRVETGSKAVVEAIGGDVVLAAGRKVELTGRGLEGIRMEVRAPEDRAVNLGTLKGDSVAIFAGQLRHSGIIQAKSLSVSGGKVILHGSKEVEVSGRIEASALDRGGSVLISGERLELKAATFIDVRHLNGGGEILVGGGVRGRDPRLQNAEEVDVEEGVQLKADATLSGKGGTVVVRAEDRVDFRGEITARGAGGGSGGYVEVWAPDLRYKGKVDITAGRGEAAPAPPGGNDSTSEARPDAAPPRSKPGKQFEAIAIIPVRDQPQDVQAAVREPEAETMAAMARMGSLSAQSSEPKDPYERKVVVNAVQCTVTR